MPQKRNCFEAALELGPLWESNRLILKCTIHRRRKKKEQSHRGCRKVVKWNHERTEKKDRKGRKRSLWYYREIHLFIRGNWVGFAQLKSYNQLFNDWKESWNWERWEVLRKKKKKSGFTYAIFIYLLSKQHQWPTWYKSWKSWSIYLIFNVSSLDKQPSDHAVHCLPPIKVCWQCILRQQLFTALK